MIVKDLSNSFHPCPKPLQKKQKSVEKTAEKNRTEKVDRKSGQIKGKKHKQTKATEISQKVKKAVWERDKHRCIVCYKLVQISCANAHFIKRSRRRERHRRKYSYIMPKMPLSRRFWSRY